MNTNLVLTPCPLSEATHLYYETTNTLISFRVLSQLREDITYMIGAESVRVEPSVFRVPPHSEGDVRPVMSFDHAERIAANNEAIIALIHAEKKIHAIKYLRDISIERGFRPIPLIDAKRIIFNLASEINGPHNDAS